MRTISRTAKFKKDYRREAKGQHRATLDADHLAAVSLLANDQPLPDRFHDHPLMGEYTNHRECHLKPDLLLIYKKPDNRALRLVRRVSQRAVQTGFCGRSGFVVSQV
jgi:mRNA interferase YafQ